jgi:DNA-binding response OmpR family regulator
MRLLVVEDEPELAALIARVLDRAGFATDRFDRLDDADLALAGTRYEALVLDLGLPDGDGMSLLRRLRTAGSQLPILILTARDAPGERVRGLNAGADDYLVKPFYLDELVARIKALLRRPGRALGTRLEAANLRFETTNRQATVDGAPVRLGRREAALLEALFRRLGQVITKEALEEGLYAFDEEVGPNALEVTVHRLRRKLTQAGARVQIHTLRGIGYLLDEAEP